MILQWRLIDLCCDEDFVGTIRLNGIQMLWALCKGGIEYIFSRVGGWVGVVPWIAATRAKKNDERGQQVFNDPDISSRGNGFGKFGRGIVHKGDRER
jgi:hypothetical protein